MCWAFISQMSATISTERGAIDLVAYERGTSIYAIGPGNPDASPSIFLTMWCSLKPDVDRLTMSCIMEIDSKGNILSYDIFKIRNSLGCPHDLPPGKPLLDGAHDEGTAALEPFDAHALSNGGADVRTLQ